MVGAAVEVEFNKCYRFLFLNQRKKNPLSIDILFMRSLFSFSYSKNTIAVLLAAVSAFIAPVASAYDWTDGFDLSAKSGDRWSLIASPYTYHFHPSDEHKAVWLIGTERERADGSIAGAAFFSNSFGQDSGYVFPWGQMYRGVFDQPKMYAQWTAGMLYGYVGKYQHKVPLNYGGFSPAIIPALGWEFDSKQRVQVDLLGLNAIMFQFSQPFK